MFTRLPVLLLLLTLCAAGTHASGGTDTGSTFDSRAYDLREYV